MKCSYCSGEGTVFIVDRWAQGQSYGPEAEGHREMCPRCGGTGEIPGPLTTAAKPKLETQTE